MLTTLIQSASGETAKIIGEIPFTILMYATQDDEIGIYIKEGSESISEIQRFYTIQEFKMHLDSINEDCEKRNHG